QSARAAKVHPKKPEERHGSEGRTQNLRKHRKARRSTHASPSEAETATSPWSEGWCVSWCVSGTGVGAYTNHLHAAPRCYIKVGKDSVSSQMASIPVRKGR